MTRANTCVLDSHRIGITEAIELRDAAHRHHEDVPDFRCRRCGKPVRPHKASSYGEAHFEHHERNAGYALSDPAR